MKQIFHKIASMLLAFVVLFSTMSFTINMHYCGGNLVDTAIFHKAKTCGMEMQMAISTSKCSMTKSDCCSDKQLVVDGQDELHLSFNKLNLKQQLIITSFVYTYLNLFEELEESVTLFLEYPSPLIVRQIYKLDEVYLI